MYGQGHPLFYFFVWQFVAHIYRLRLHEDLQRIVKSDATGYLFNGGHMNGTTKNCIFVLRTFLPAQAQVPILPFLRHHRQLLHIPNTHSLTRVAMPCAFS